MHFIKGGGGFLSIYMHGWWAFWRLALELYDARKAMNDLGMRIKHIVQNQI